MTIKQKFTADRNELSDALTRVGQVISTNGPEYLQRIRGEVSTGWLVLTGSNSVLSMKTGIKLTDAEGELGPFVFPSEGSKAVGTLPAGVVTVEEAHGSIMFVSEKGPVFDFRKTNPEDFPTLSFPSEDPIEVGEDVLTNVTRYLGAVKAETTLITTEDGHMRIVATDNYRMAIIDTEIPFGDIVVVPSEFFGMVEQTVGLDDVSMSIDETKVSMRSEARALTAQRSAKSFPKYEGVLSAFGGDTEHGVLTVNRADLLGATKRALVLMGDKSFVPLRFKLTKKHGAEVSIQKTDVGQEDEQVGGEWSGEPTDIAFSVRYLRDGLQALSGETVTITVQDSKRAALMQSPDDPMFRYLLMPVVI